MFYRDKPEPVYGRQQSCKMFVSLYPAAGCSPPPTSSHLGSPTHLLQKRADWALPCKGPVCNKVEPTREGRGIPALESERRESFGPYATDCVQLRYFATTEGNRPQKIPLHQQYSTSERRISTRLHYFAPVTATRYRPLPLCPSRNLSIRASWR
jgi:hypothetical protein